MLTSFIFLIFISLDIFLSVFFIFTLVLIIFLSDVIRKISLSIVVLVLLTTFLKVNEIIISTNFAIIADEIINIKEVIFKHLKKRLSFVGIKKIEQLKNSFNLLNNEIYDSLGYMDIASALEDKNIDLDLSLNRNRFPESLKIFESIIDSIMSLIKCSI